MYKCCVLYICYVIKAMLCLQNSQDNKGRTDYKFDLYTCIKKSNKKKKKKKKNCASGEKNVLSPGYSCIIRICIHVGILG